MYVPPTLRFMVLEDLFCLQKLRLQQSLYGVAAAFFISLFRAVIPLAAPDWKRQIAHWPFRTISGSRCLKAHRLPGITPIFLP